MRPFWFIHERAFRDLECQLARSDPIHLEQVHHCGEEPGIVQRTRRKIDCYIHKEPRLLPVQALPYRSLKHPTSQRANEPGILGQWNELLRRDGAIHWMRPTHEGLDTHHLARRERDLGLVMQQQHVIYNRLAQLTD